MNSVSCQQIALIAVSAVLNCVSSIIINASKVDGKISVQKHNRDSAVGNFQTRGHGRGHRCARESVKATLLLLHQLIMNYRSYKNNKTKFMSKLSIEDESSNFEFRCSRNLCFSLQLLFKLHSNCGGDIKLAKTFRFGSLSP